MKRRHASGLPAFAASGNRRVPTSAQSSASPQTEGRTVTVDVVSPRRSSDIGAGVFPEILARTETINIPPYIASVRSREDARHVTGDGTVPPSRHPRRRSRRSPPDEELQATVGLLRPRSTVTASRNNNQLESGSMKKRRIPRRPCFPRFSLFS